MNGKENMMNMVSISLYDHVFAECYTLESETRFPNSMRDDACLAYIREGRHEIFSATHKIVATDKESILMISGAVADYINQVNAR